MFFIEASSFTFAWPASFAWSVEAAEIAVGWLLLLHDIRKMTVVAIDNLMSIFFITSVLFLNSWLSNLPGIEKIGFYLFSAIGPVGSVFPVLYVMGTVDPGTLTRM